VNRRAFLTTTGAVGIGLLAGCTGGSDDTTGGSTATGAATDAGSATAAGGVLAHESARGIDSQPFLGPDPTEGGNAIVAFEDPSCPRCRVFEEEIVPEIRSKLVEPGLASLVFRGYPVVYDWGKPAVRALEATFARDSAAFWALAGHYFGNQRRYRGAERAAVFGMTADFLDGETALDGAAVTDAAAAGEFDDAVALDREAGRDAGAGRTTPHIFLFRDGVYQTKVAGSVSYNLIASVLEV
jgi:protein-disulfide isomerase